MIVAPLLLLASTVANAFGEGLGGDALGGMIQVYAGAAFALAVVGLTHLLEPRLPRASTLLLVIGLVGCAGVVAFGIDSLVYSYDSAAALSEVEGVAEAGPALFLPGLVFPLSIVALGAAVVRSELTPKAAGFALLAAGLLFPVSRIGGIEPLALAVDVLFVAGLAPIGLSVLRHRSDSPDVVASTLATGKAVPA